MSEQRQSIIITFKPKDQRADKQTDKVDIVRSVLAKGVRPRFLDATTLGIGGGGPMGEAPLVGYDVNQYEAPIVNAHLTEDEIAALRKNANVALVEEDASCYALGGFPPNMQVEGQPSALAETIPVGVSQIKAPAAWGNSQGKG